MKVSGHCYAITGLYYVNPWAVNAGFITGRDKTMVIDSGSCNLSAQTIYGYAENVRPGNEIILLNTEKHLDHIGGNGFFKERNIRIYGHESVDRIQGEFDSDVHSINADIKDVSRRENNEGYIPFMGTIIVNPDSKITGWMEINLGDCAVEIIPTPGHTQSNLSVYHRMDRVLYCGDCVLPGYLPNTDNGDSCEWIKSLELIRKLDVEVIVPGHGDIISGRNDVLEVINMMSSLISGKMYRGGV